jgi:hypothetical protein
MRKIRGPIKKSGWDLEKKTNEEIYLLIQQADTVIRICKNARNKID